MVVREDDRCEIAGLSTSYLYLSCESFRDVVIEAFLRRHATTRLSSLRPHAGFSRANRDSAKR